MNVQLTITADLAGTPRDGRAKYFLDLYEEDPIKLNFSIEDITNAEAKSIFSRTFRVPSTTNNYQFFKTAYMINAYDFDVSRKYDASILVNGAEFRKGHIRLQKIYWNGTGNIIDYEIVFLGETKNFGESVGNKMMNELDLSHLTHDYTLDNIVQSWSAYPQGTINGGLEFGDVLYPLVNHGNTYDENNMVQEPTVANGFNMRRFTSSANPLPYFRFKPMIRAKAIIDKIFETAGFTYTSDFFNSETFYPIYVSAFGNDGGISIPLGSANFLDVMYPIEQGLDNTVAGTFMPSNVLLDPSDNYNEGTGIYTAPVSGDYNLRMLGVFKFAAAIGSGGVSVTVKLMKNGVQVPNYGSTSITTLENFVQYCTYDHTESITLAAGDQVYAIYEFFNGTSNFASAVNHRIIIDEQTTTGSNTTEMQPGVFLDNEYKQIDFIKDILKKFRLVMAPDRNKDKNFIIEPWSDYIASGDYYDWTDKVDVSKDWIIEPTFFTQSDRITFSDAADQDHLQIINQEAFKESFGTLIFDSTNDLLKGERKVECSFASSPIMHILGGTDPVLGLFSSDSEGITTLHDPIKPKTRLLYYNGLKDFESANQYYLEDEDGNTVAYTSYALVSYNEAWPPTSSSLNLNWQTETGYAGISEIGVSCFDRYWGNYISQLYDPFGRRVVMYLTLNNVDLQDFSFDDLIWIKDTYYYVESITDAPVGSTASVKVTLIKVLDTVTVTGEPPVPPVEPEDPWNSVDEDFNREFDEWNIK